GGSRGIGRAACVALAQAGADVVVHYHTDRANAERVAAEIRALGRRAATVQADVTGAEDVDRLADEAGEFAGPAGLHVLLNYPGAERPVIEEQAIKRFQEPEDLVGLIVFLASRESGFTTGQTILADGGRVFL